MSAGSAVIYLGSTLHAGGTNNTDSLRRGVHMSYCLGMLEMSHPTELLKEGKL